MNNKTDQEFPLFWLFLRKALKLMKNTLSTYLFWDIDQDTLDLHRHKRFIIERMLQYGRPAGGTALAVHLGHRKSDDLDLFSEKEFSIEKLCKIIENLNLHNWSY